MPPSIWFNDLPVLGKLPPDQGAAKLREVGDEESATALESAEREAVTKTFGRRSWWPFQNKPWQHTAHAFGYLPPALSSNEPLSIRHAGDIKADPDLKNSRLKITLDCLRVADYPGGGEHQVLFDFYAQNQVPGQVEHLHFNATCRVREGERAASLGYPIFVGLNVGSEGVAFKCFTVNVKNSADEAFLSFLDSDVFKAGLKLASTMQPAIGPLSGMAMGITRAIAQRHQNVAVQDFYLGLDFSTIATRARLAEGSYLAMQLPESLETLWDWSDWIYQPGTGQIVNRENPNQLIPYNYLVFGVSRYGDD
jgi:hypothetical protein